MSSRYDDILRLPRPEPIRARMPSQVRAAQFAPFAALVGYDGVVAEAARLTDQRIELSEDAALELNEQLRLAAETIGTGQEVEFLYFVPDARKDGGRYVNKKGAVKRIDDVERLVLLQDGSSIPIGEILAVHMGLSDKTT